MKLTLCNEVVRDLAFAEQCELAASLGYMGLEIAPFTLGDDPHLLSQARRAELRRAAADAGLDITGLHWLLVAPEGLSITSADAAVRWRTLEVMRRLTDLCASLGGRTLVHGSPAQRRLGGEPGAEARGQDMFAAIAQDAEKAGVVYCVEPLAREDTDFINTVSEAAALVDEVGSPALRTMIDCRAASLSESVPVPRLIRKWVPTGLIGHIHLNDPNKRGPGQGEMKFGPVLEALDEVGYDGFLGVEPFLYEPSGVAAAARAAGYVMGLTERVPRLRQPADQN